MATYADRFGPDGVFLYHYRDPGTPSAAARTAAERDNEAVRVAMRHSLPIVHWFGVVPGQCRPFFPAYYCGDVIVVLRGPYVL